MRQLALFAVALTLLAGCEGPAFIAKTVTGEDKVKKQFELPNRKTLVLVDDPNQMMANPVLVGVVASNVGHHLALNEVLTQPVVSERELAAIRNRLGRKYRETPIDEIGRMAGAEQVIYVRIEDAYLQPAPSFYKPTATLELKVVDAAEGKRMYPEAPPLIEKNASARGQTMEVAFRYKGLEAESPGQDAMLARKLAERIGLQVAQLFYDHKPEPRWTKE